MLIFQTRKLHTINKIIQEMNNSKCQTPFQYKTFQLINKNSSLRLLKLSRNISYNHIEKRQLFCMKSKMGNTFHINSRS